MNRFLRWSCASAVAAVLFAGILAAEARATPVDFELIIEARHSLAIFWLNVEAGDRFAATFTADSVDFQGTCSGYATVTDFQLTIGDTQWNYPSLGMGMVFTNSVLHGINMYEIDSTSGPSPAFMAFLPGDNQAFFTQFPGAPPFPNLNAFYTVGSGKRVCYYDLGYETVPGAGNPNQVPAIVAAGHAPIHLASLFAANTWFCDVLFAQNPDDSAYAADWISNLADIDAAVRAGMVLVFHDRYVTGAAANIPGLGAASCVRDLSDPANIEIATAGTSITHGPQGFVTDSNLDGFSSSSHGYCDAASLPASSAVLLSRTLRNEATTMSYRHGSGAVVYSTIPLDYWLYAAPNAISDVYAPNVVQHGVDLMPATVCYYELGTGVPRSGQGNPTQVAAIVTAGQLPVDVTDPDAGQLAGCDVLLAQNPGNSGYGTEWTSSLSDIDAAVRAGMVLVFHDRYVTGAAGNVPGLGAASCTRDFMDSQNIEVQDDGTSVTHGPGGDVDNSTLDGFDVSSHGFCTESSLPPGARAILSRTAPSEATTMSYRHGSGAVVYSTIPLDHWLSVAPNAMSDVYAPNVAQYGVDLLAETVCYYDLATGQGNPSQIAPITAAGHIPLDIAGPGALQTWSCDVLFAQNPSNFVWAGEWTSNLADIDAAVRDGITLVFHDRYVIDAALNIPGLESATCARDFTDPANIEVVNDTTVVTYGPGGVVDNTTLDGFTSSSHGYCAVASLPADSLVILSRSLAAEATTMSYPLDAGAVLYSTIPLDYWLPAAPNTMSEVYAPNVVEYGVRVVPEPVGPLQLLAGLAGLFVLARVRRRTAKRG